LLSLWSGCLTKYSKMQHFARVGTNSNSQTSHPSWGLWVLFHHHPRAGQDLNMFEGLDDLSWLSIPAEFECLANAAPPLACSHWRVRSKKQNKKKAIFQYVFVEVICFSLFGAVLFLSLFLDDSPLYLLLLLLLPSSSVTVGVVVLLHMNIVCMYRCDYAVLCCDYLSLSRCRHLRCLNLR